MFVQVLSHPGALEVLGGRPGGNLTSSCDLEDLLLLLLLCEDLLPEDLFQDRRNSSTYPNSTPSTTLDKVLCLLRRAKPPHGLCFSSVLVSLASG